MIPEITIQKNRNFVANLRRTANVSKRKSIISRTAAKTIVVALTLRHRIGMIASQPIPRFKPGADGVPLTEEERSEQIKQRKKAIVNEVLKTLNEVIGEWRNAKDAAKTNQHINHN